AGEGPDDVRRPGPAHLPGHGQVGRPDRGGHGPADHQARVAGPGDGASPRPGPGPGESPADDGRLPDAAAREQAGGSGPRPADRPRGGPRPVPISPLRCPFQVAILLKVATWLTSVT